MTADRAPLRLVNAGGGFNEGDHMENETVEPKRGRWMDSDEAAAIIGVSPVQLRRTIAGHARRLPKGEIVATTDGVRARKFGRHWRVALDTLWHDPLARADGR